jgi:hypothetical protein
MAGFFGFSRPSAEMERPLTSLDDADRALIAGACTKSAVLWLKPSGEGRFHPAWHVWHEDAVHVVSGIGEQLLPNLTGPLDVLVPSKDTGARAVTFTAWGEPLAAGDPNWDDAAAALRAARLNTLEPDEQRARWASGAMITRLEPVAVVAHGAGREDEGSGAAAPARTPATTTGRRPWHLRSRSRGRLRPRWRARRSPS